MPVCSDSGRQDQRGQQANSMGCQNVSKRLSFSPVWQSVSRRQFALLSVCIQMARLLLARCVQAAAILVTVPAAGQLVDPLDAYPPRWHLAVSDCNAQLVRHSSQPRDGIGGSGCESVGLYCGAGTQALLEYRIEPTRVIDELTARVFVKSSKGGQSIGLRVRFPLLIDPATGQSVTVTLFGTSYRDVGQWQLLSIGQIEKSLRLKTVALRREYGSEADLSEVFVDAIVINAYTGPGPTTLLIDNLTVDGIVPVTSVKTITRNASPSTPPRPASEQLDTGPVETTVTERRDNRPAAFPAGRVTRILQHNGEPLEWVKTLGFDAVLLARPADHAILGEAQRARVDVYAPPPTAPEPHLATFLQPLAGYYLGTSQDATQVAAATATSERVRSWPAVWQRPVIVAPVEAMRTYAGIADALVHDLPPPIRNLRGDEEIAALAERRGRVGRTMVEAVGVQSEAPLALTRQLDAISAAIGAPRGEDIFWHALWLQVARALEASPRAILFRSSRSLTSGKVEDQRRSMALSYINHYLEVVGPLAASGMAISPLSTSDPAYRCGRIEFPKGQLLTVTSNTQHRGLTLAGDGDSLQILLPPGDATKLIWRVTQFTAERVPVQVTSQGARAEIISPDLVETLVLSGDPAIGGRLATVLRRVGAQAATDRWQLTREAIQQVREDWQAVTVTRIAPPSRSALDMLTAAERTLRDAEPMFRSGDAGATLRLVRRADAWMMKSRWQLFAALSPGRQLSDTTSCPPLLSVGGVPAQVLWWPLMSDAGWSDNLLIGGSLDSARLLGQAGWVVGRRPEPLNPTQSEVTIVQGPQAQGEGCLQASVVAVGAGPLPGGYAGTAVQIRSPSIRAAAKTALRIDAKVRTLGFGGPDQGVLVYDSICGPELGVLVRATPQWQNVRLYRQTLSDAEVEVLFELIGAGEVLIDDVQVRVWNGEASDPLPLRRIGQLPDESAAEGEALRR